MAGARKRGRKAGIELSLKEIVGLILAVAGIVVLVGFIFLGSKILFSQPEQGSVESLNNINDAITTLMKYKDAECYIPIYVQPGYALVGFDFGNHNATDPCKHLPESVGTHTEVIKPSTCGPSPCVCLCNAGWGNLGEQDCINNNGCYNFDPQNLELLRGEPEAAGMTDSMVLYGSSCQVGVEYKVSNILLTKNGKTLVIKRVDNTMGAEPCNVLKYK